MFGVDRYTSDKFGLTVASIVLTAIAVGLRLFIKIRHKQGIHADDYWILMGLAWFYASASVGVWGNVTGNGGMEMRELQMLARKNKTLLKDYQNYFESAFLGINLLAVSAYCIKMSILFFYVRIFSIEVWFKRAAYGTMAISTIWVIATVISFCQICQPIDSFWNKLKPGKCQSGNNYFLGTGLTDTFIDIIILLLPVRMAFQLQLPVRTKIAVAGIFALGGFVIVTNIIRLTFMYKPGDNFVNFAETEKWAHIHWMTAIICACLPIYKPLWTSLSAAAGSWISKHTSTFRSRIGLSSSNNTSKNDPYYRMGGVGSIEYKEGDLESGFSQLSKSGSNASRSSNERPFVVR